MPLSRTQERLRSARRRQDESYRERQRIYNATHRRLRRQQAIAQDTSSTIQPWWLSFHAYIQGLLEQNSQHDNAWNRSCRYCSATLLQGESNDFCCNNGKRIIPPLPPLPPHIQSLSSGFLNSKISSFSRRLNNLFSFTAIGATGSFARFQNGIASVAVTGRVYHRMLDVEQADHSIHWFLYDERERDNQGLTWSVPQIWIDNVREDLEDINPYVSSLRLFHTQNNTAKTALELSEFSSNGDFAAVIHASNSVEVSPRNILIWRHSDALPSFISIYSHHYEPLQYPLLFPHGSPGWGLSSNFTQIEWYRGRLLADPRFQLFGRLTAEYVCDMYCRVEEQRLHYIRSNRDKSLRPDMSLPSSFLGSRRWASDQSADGLALARHFGRPSFFVTMTCNPDWPEIRMQLRQGQSACDVPVIVARVFKQRLQRLMHILRHKFASMVYMIKVIEFQKRGLPHAHLILKIDPEVPLHKLDELITCRLPDNDERLREKIKKFMSHNRNHLSSETSRCNRGGKCIYGFPHPITPQTSIDEDTGRIHYQRLHADEQWIAPHIPDFVDLFDCHIYWDVVSTVHVFMYLYKYLFKGPDHVWYQMQGASADEKDEITDYVNGRYLSAPEAVWRILNFDITSKEPSVICLPIHLPEEGIPQFYQGNRTASTASNLIRYFYRPTHSLFDSLLYNEYYEQYVQYPYKPADAIASNEFLERIIPFVPTRYKIRARLRNRKIARLRILSPAVGEAFYLRALLMHRACRSFEELRTINDTLYDTFHEAAIAFGLFHDADEGYYALQEATLMYSTPSQLRFLFSRIVLEGYPARPLWDTFYLDLSLDFRTNTGSTDVGVNMCLQDLSTALFENRRTLAEFGLPTPTLPSDHLNEIVAEKTYFERCIPALENEVNRNLSSLSYEQRDIFTSLLRYVLHPNDDDMPKFVEGRPGRGKTFLIKTLASKIRSAKNIVLIVATSAIAATMYEKGQTAHSMFKIPVNEVRLFLTEHVLRLTASKDNVNIVSSIKPNTARANPINQASLIIWDELPLANRAVLESVNNVCQSLRKNYRPFGGIPFIGVGDFRQVAPVVKGSGMSSILQASIKSSFLWKAFRVHTLHSPIRSAADLPFTNMVDKIGECFQQDTTTLPIVRKITTIQDAIDFLFPSDALHNIETVWKRSYLTPLNMYVDEFNSRILNNLSGDCVSYYSADVVKENNETFLDHPQANADYLSMLTSPGAPPHKLDLKIGCVCTVMRNMSIQKGLVKNAKVIIHRLGDRVIEVRVIDNHTGNLGGIEYLPRVRFDFTPPHVTWTVQRLQFPLHLAYAATFHSCVGATLDKVVLDQRIDVFTHGQLYTACSRVRHRDDIKILITEDNVSGTMKNIVYKELLL